MSKTISAGELRTLIARCEQILNEDLPEDFVFPDFKACKAIDDKIQALLWDAHGLGVLCLPRLIRAGSWHVSGDKSYHIPSSDGYYTVGAYLGASAETVAMRQKTVDPNLTGYFRDTVCYSLTK